GDGPRLVLGGALCAVQQRPGLDVRPAGDRSGARSAAGLGVARLPVRRDLRLVAEGRRDHRLRGARRGMTTWIGTSWKMTKTLAQAGEYVDSLVAAASPGRWPGVQPFVVPPATALST